MISRSLSRRLERLETRLAPAGESVTIQVWFPSPDGSAVEGPRFIVPGAGGLQAGSVAPASGSRPGLTDRQYREGPHP
jgi:hypothetical protein